MSDQMNINPSNISPNTATTAVLNYAREYASGTSGTATTGHLLLGLIQVQSSLTTVFKTFGISARDVQKEVVAIDKKRAASEDKSEFATPAAGAIERAYQIARDRKATEVAPVDLLLALLPSKGAEVVDSDDFTDVLLALSVDPEKLRQAVYDQLDKGSSVASSQIQNTKRPTLALDKYARDLNKWGLDGKLDPCTWRGSEIASMIEILGMRLQNNPVLVGETGVGTISVVEGLVQRILSGEVPDSLKSVRIFQLNMSLVTGGSKYRGEFEERLSKIVQEVQEDGNIILLFEDLHTIIGAGAIGEGGADAASFFKPLLIRGELRCIGTTSPDEYRQKIERDSNISGLFRKVSVAKLDVEETVEALQAVKSRFEKHHGLSYTDEALKVAAELSKRYLCGTVQLPGRAIQLIDQAGSRIKNARSNRLVVDEVDIVEIVADETKLPLANLTQSEAEKLLSMADTLHRSIIGQSDAVDAVHKAFMRQRVGLNSSKRPIGSFLFIGPTGTGKTELARMLARHLFDTTEALIRLDMSEYMEAVSVSKLIGTSAGYVGYKEGGTLTEPVLNRPYCVLLLDELEKANPAVLNLLLQILDNGSLTDGAGRTVDFTNAVIIATSNVGSRVLVGSLTQIGIKLGETKPTVVDRKSDVIERELAARFPPEFLNRWDKIVEFSKLQSEELELIVQLLIKEIYSPLELRWNIRLSLSTEAAKFIVKRGDPRYGARPLRRTLQELVETPLSIGIISGEFRDCEIEVVVENDQIALKRVEQK